MIGGRIVTGTGIRYAKTPDGVHIAYEVIGQGEVDHVFLAEFGASLEARWAHPAHIPQKRFFASLSRVINIDLRGTGSSDRVAPERLANVDDWVTDIVAVLDALEVERAVITGEGTFGRVAIQMSLTHPDRVQRMTLANSTARGTRTNNYPVGFTDDELEDIATYIGENWGTGLVTAQFTPALASDPSLIEICAHRERLTASPSTAEAWVRAVSNLDVRDLLPRIRVPTLVYYTGDFLHAPVEHSRYLAEHIPDAILVEAPGHSFYVPDEPDQLGAWAEFIVGGPALVTTDRKLATVLFTDVIGSTQTAASVGDQRWTERLEQIDAFVLSEVERQGGRLVKQTGDGHLATFDSPGGAVRAASSIASRVHIFGVEMRCGLHVGEIEIRPSGDIGGLAVHAAARIMDASGPRQVLVSRTVADLASGPESRFEPCGSRELKGIPSAFDLYEVVLGST